ncbi:MAG: hypothetical protein AAGI30_07785, partial [Planctomycetota bacterium]
NAQFFYQISIDNLSGTGLSFEDGDLVSMDLSGDVTVSLFLAFNNATPLVTTAGTFTASGLDYAFDVTGSGGFGPFSGTNILMNRAGTASVIPAPASLMALAPAGAAALGRRRRH